jgi:hypothetical protein
MSDHNNRPFTHAARLAAQAIIAVDPWEKQLWLDEANTALTRAWTELHASIKPGGEAWLARDPVNSC